MTDTGAVAAGVDLGGSNLRVGLVTGDGEVLWRHGERTPASHSPEDVADAIVRCLREGAATRNVGIESLTGVGIGVPGAVDPATGMSLLSPNFGWRDVPFGALLRDRLGGPRVVIDNDVSVVTYGEWQFGEGQGVSDLMCVTVGTGVGAGLILRGEPYLGPTGVAGEIGHIQLDKDGPVCGCGNRGCLEVYASAKAVARIAHERGLTSSDGGPISAEEVADRGAARDPVAAEIVAGAAAALARGVAAAVNLLNLSRVVIGGGLARAGETFWSPFQAAFRPQVMAPHLAHVSVVPASLGDDAGILGGAWMVRRDAGTDP
jgi:glucokinase